MLAPSRTSLAVRSTLGTALLAAMALATQAQTITIDQMEARGDYILNGALTDALINNSAGPASFVDVLSFPFDVPSGGGLHSYGSSNGVFGSRSSGFGVFDLSGSFVINLTITNNQATAQNAIFNFHITPGLLELTDLPYTGSQFAEAGLGFNIVTSNGKSFNSTAVLRSDTTGLLFSSTGDSSLYGGAGANYFVAGADRTLDLGELASGESITLSYTLNSYAVGNTIVAQTTVVPARTVQIPGYWTAACSTEIPQLAVELVNNEQAVVACTGEPVFVPPQEVTLPETTYIEGESGTAHASSGDPFAFNLGPGQLALPPANNGQPVSVTLTAVNPDPNPNPDPGTNPIPEPGAMSLVLLALTAAGVASRRRKH